MLLFSSSSLTFNLIPTVKEEIGRYPENTRKERHTSKPAGCWNEQNSHRKKTKKKTPHLPHQGNKIVIKLEDGILGVTSTCYLAIKLDKFTKCPAEQIVKYKLNNKKILLSHLSSEINSQQRLRWRMDFLPHLFQENVRSYIRTLFFAKYQRNVWRNAKEDKRFLRDIYEKMERSFLQRSTLST